MFIKLLLVVLMASALVGCGSSDKDNVELGKDISTSEDIVPVEVSPDLENPESIEDDSDLEASEPDKHSPDSSSTDKDVENSHAEQFSLDGYEGRTVSTDTLEGTWVVVIKGTYDILSDDITESGKSYIKQILTIYNDNDQYFAGDCQGNNYPIVFSENTLKFHHYHAPLEISNNNALSQSSSESIIQEDGSTKEQSWDTKAIKVSNQIYPFAYWNYEVSGGETETGQSNSICFTASLGVKKELEETIYTMQASGVTVSPISISNTRSTWADTGKEPIDYDTLIFISGSRVDVFLEQNIDVVIDYEVDSTPGAEQVVFEAGAVDKYANGMIDIKL